MPNDVLERPQLNDNLIPVEIDSGEQPWATIFLRDGNKLRVQLNIASVHRHPTKKGPDGMPEYLIAAGFNTQAFPRKGGSK